MGKMYLSILPLITLNIKDFQTTYCFNEKHFLRVLKDKYLDNMVKSDLTMKGHDLIRLICGI